MALLAFVNQRATLGRRCFPRGTGLRRKSALDRFTPQVQMLEDRALPSILTAGPLTPPRATEGQAFRNVTVFNFTANPPGTVSDYTAMVQTGDGQTVTLTGTPSADGQIVVHAGGGYDVQLSHTYAEELTNQTFRVQVADADGDSVSSATVAVRTFVDNSHGLIFPTALAFDRSGNLYVANGGTNTISKVTPAGVVSTFVDNSHGLSDPTGLAFDGSSNLYVANEGNNTISKVTPAGVVTTFVNNSHGLNQPDGLAFDGSGNLYVSNHASYTILKVTPAGVVSTFVDNSHGLEGPAGLAFDRNGNLYVANFYANTISEVTPAGVVSTFVDTSHGLNLPVGLAFDGDGNLYVSNYASTNTILQVTPAGVVSTFVNNTQGLNGPNGLAFDGSGTLYVANEYGDTISQVGGPGGFSVADAPLTAGVVTPPSAIEGQPFRNIPVFHFTDADANGTASDYTAVVSLGDGHSVTLTGTPSTNGQIVASAGGGFDVQLSYTYTEELTNQTFRVQVRDAGGAFIASANLVVSTFVDNSHGLSYPAGLAFDRNGNLYVANTGGNTILKVTPAGVVSTFVDNSHGLNSPAGLAFDGSGNLYVANGDNNTINRVTPAGVVSTFVDNSHGLNEPVGLAFDGNGNLYVGNAIGNTISEVTPAGVVSTFVDNSQGLNWPAGLAFDSNGNLYVANLYGYKILKVTPAGAVSTFVQGLSNPAGLAFDGGANLYVANAGGNTISEVTPAGVVSTFVDNSHGLNGPAALAFDSNGNLYVTNYFGNTISKIALVLVSVADPAVSPTGGFTVTGTENTDTGAQTVATFTDPGGAENLADYSATIDWGDGTTSKGTITLDTQSGTFTVQGSHQYADEGSYTITVTIGHDTAADAVTTSCASITDASLAPGDGSTIAAVAGQDTGSQVVATFTDTDPGAPEDLMDYAALIDWGDGSTPSAGTIAYTADGFFTVAGNHTYATSGTYTITVTILHDTADPITVLGEADVTDGNGGSPGGAGRGVQPGRSALPAHAVDQVFLPDQVAQLLGCNNAPGSAFSGNGPNAVPADASSEQGMSGTATAAVRLGMAAAATGSHSGKDHTTAAVQPHRLVCRPALRQDLDVNW